MPEELLTRDQFREAVLARDGHRCVVCHWSDPTKPNCGLDAHHIMERRLWDDGGYYLSNGAALCDDHDGVIGCHRLAEQTQITCEAIRTNAQIGTTLIPRHLYGDFIYDKWGNILMPNGTRIKGELFGDESVRKALSKVLHLFSDLVKYPRTYHLPWSPGITDDDEVLRETDHFNGRRVIVTEKVDGENTTMYRDHLHARSVDGESDPTQGWVRNLQGQVGYQLSPGWRICGENLFAQHTLHYSGLPSYFLLFSIWDENNICLSWDDTVLYAEVLGLTMVPKLYDGPWDWELVRKFHQRLNLNQQEGYVVRIADSFPYAQFRHAVAKYVRAEHVGTSHHWRRQRFIKNELLETI